MVERELGLRERPDISHLTRVDQGAFVDTGHDQLNPREDMSGLLFIGIMLSILNSMIHERVGNNIKELRTTLGLTQAQLAELVGVARVSIVAIENGRFIPTIETALHISVALGVPVERIFWLKDETV